MSEREDQVAERLHAAGLRVTRSRLAVYEALAEGDHLDAEGVARGVRERLGSVSTQAVYDTLHLFTRMGLARRIEPAGSPARFETRTGDNHHHLACRHCGAVTDVDCAAGMAPCLEPSGGRGWLLDEAEVTFWGVCPDCSRTRSSVSPDTARSRG